MRQLLLSEIGLVLETLRSLRDWDGRSACIQAMDWLKSGACVDDPTLREIKYVYPQESDFLHWLGMCLVMHGYLPSPDIHPDDGDITTDLTELSVEYPWTLHCEYRNAEKYWPVDDLLDACRRYNEAGPE